MVRKKKRLTQKKKKDVPIGTAGADASDPTAGDTNKASDGTHIDAQKGKNRGDGAVGRLASAVAALEAASGALTTRGASFQSTCGGGKGSSGEGENGESFELHVWLNESLGYLNWSLFE